MQVALLAVDDMGEALLLRAMLESQRATVHLKPVDKPSDFFRHLDCADQAIDIALISGHGDEGGFVFPEMAEGVDELVLPGNRIGADLLSRRLTGLPPVVISTACDTGTSNYARAMLGGDAQIYVAPGGYPDGVSVPVLLDLAFYRVIHAGASWQSAVQAANTFFTLENRFEVYRA